LCDISRAASNSSCIFLERDPCLTTSYKIFATEVGQVRQTVTDTDHVSKDTRWYWSIPDVRSFRGADCDIEHCLVVAKVREIFAVSRQTAQKFDMERFNLKNLSELEVRKQCQINISNRFTALENLKNTVRRKEGLGKH